MAGIYEMAMNGLGIAQEGQERKKQRTLAELVGKAYGAKGPERQQYMSQAYSLDPTTASQADTAFAQHDDRQRASLARAAKMVISAPEEMRASLWPRIVQGLEADGITGLKPQWSPEALPMAEKIAAMYGEPEQDNTPAAIRELQLLQQNPQLAELDMKRRTAGFARPQIVSVPTGDGGSQQMIFDGTQFTKPNYGGGQAAPNAGGFYEGVQSVISPLGGILGSTTGGQHNVGSAHYSGNAVDIPMGASASPEAKANAQNMIADLQARGFNVRDERVRPNGQKEWSGPHLHVERGLGGGQQVAQVGPLGYTPPKRESDRQAPAGYRWGADGNLQVIPGGPADKGSNATTGGVNAQKLHQANSTKMAQFDAADRAIKRLEQASQSIAGNKVFDGGPLDQYALQYSQQGQEMEQAAAAMMPILTALTRVPGMGSQSDLEAKLAQLQMPSAKFSPEVNANAIKALREYMTGLRQAVQGTRPAESSGLATPQSQADFDALPQGALYVDPEDGKTYRKD